MIRRLAAPALLVGALVVAAPADAARPTLRLGLAGSDCDWPFRGGLDPQTGTYCGDAWSLFRAMCTTLVSFPERTGRSGDVPVPDGAVGYPRVSRDGRTYTFTIRANLRFSDGTPVRAENYAYAIGRLLDPRLHSDMAHFGTGIKTVHGRGRTLRIVLAQPAGDLLSRLALPMFCPVPTNYPVDPAGVTLTVASGPYRLASFIASRSLVLRPNRFYRGPREQRFGAITLTIGGTTESLARDVASGKLDYSFNGVPRAERPAYKKRYGFGGGRLFYKPYPALFYVAINANSPIFRNNLPLRRAIGYAIDRAELVRTLDPFTGRRAGQLIPEGIGGHSSSDVYPLEGAKLKLARRLAQGHLRGRRVVFYAWPGRLADIIVYNLRRIGLVVDDHRLAAGVVPTKLKQPGEPWDLAMLLWIADWADPAQFVAPFLGPDALTGFRSQRYERRLRAAERLTGPARARAFGTLARDLLRDEAPIVPYYNPTGVSVVSQRLSCVSFNTMTDINLPGLCLRG